MRKVLVLGAQGMLGSMVARVLAADSELEVTTTARHGGSAEDIGHRPFDAVLGSVGPLLDSEQYDWVINAIGVIKPRIDESVAGSVENAIAVNAIFPYRLAAEAAVRGQRVIQIATDCVFSGARGSYDEAAAHDPLDVYGKTKSLGEVPVPNMLHLRCSIVGPEQGTTSSLLEWILSSSAGSQLPGFTNHQWNGITTLHFAKLCAAVVQGTDAPSLQHIVPGDAVSKAELLELVLAAFGRNDVTVKPGSAPEAIDRTLSTRNPDANQRVWRAAGYDSPPTIGTMLRELAAHEAQHAAAA